MSCRNRPEGFSTKSIYSSLPTTCFTDTVLLPLPTFILLLALTLLTILAISTKSSSRRLRINSSPNNVTPLTTNRWHQQLFANKDGLHRPLPYKLLIGIYYLFILGTFLLAILEIARLSTIHFGIALLPFPIIGIVIAGLLHLTRGLNFFIPHYQVMNIIFWALSIVFSVIKTVGLVEQEGIEGRKGSMYPVEDQVTDTGVMAGLYLLLVGIEGGLWFWKGRLVRRASEALKEGSGSELQV